MFTLTKASQETKLILKWGAILIAFVFILMLLIRGFNLLRDTFFPAPPPNPTVTFGKLPGVSFSQSQYNAAKKYTLDTVSGTLPTFPTQLKVYKVNSQKADLLALKTTGEKVRSVGFDNGPFKYSDQLYFWTDSSGEFLKTIRVNIVSGDFIIFSPFYFNQSILSSDNLPNEEDSIKNAENFLDQLDLLSEDIDLSKTTTQLLSINNGQLNPTNSLSSAQAIRVNFYQKDIDGLPLVYENPNETNINLLITGGENQSQIVRGSYIFKKPNGSSTYPIKTAKEAFDELQNGKAFIVQSDNSANININNIYLAYFVGNKSQEYIYPVVVFEGKNFQAYVSAVTDEWINN